MEKQIYLFLLLSFIMLIPSCVTSVIKEQISSLNIYMVDIVTNRTVDKLVPGVMYLMKIDVITENKNKITNPNYEEFIYSSKNDLLEIAFLNEYISFYWEHIKNYQFHLQL